MNSFANLPALLPGGRPDRPVPLPPAEVDLPALCDEIGPASHPDTWPAWTDTPIPYRLAEPPVPDLAPAGGLKRRTFLALLGLAGLGGSGLALAAAESPGPLARALRRLEDAQRRSAEAYALPRPETAGLDEARRLEVVGAFEDRQGECASAAVDAFEDLASAIAEAAGYVPGPLPDARSEARQAPVVAVRGGGCCSSW